MNQKRAEAMLKTGIIPGMAVSELARWGVELPQQVPVETDPEEALEGIREAIESPETVAMRTTDMDALRFYKENEKMGRLYYASANGTTFVDVSYAKNQFNQYLIPWNDEDIYALMLDPDTYLKPKGEERIYFSDVHELYYGEKKAFMVCIPLDKNPRTATLKPGEQMDWSES